MKSTSEILISVLTCTVRHFSEVAAALAEFERELISECTKAGLESARACGPKCGRPFKIPPAKVRLVMTPMGQPETNIAALGRKPGITRQTLYRQVSPTGELREHGRKLLTGENNQFLRTLPPHREVRKTTSHGRKLPPPLHSKDLLRAQ